MERRSFLKFLGIMRAAAIGAKMAESAEIKAAGFPDKWQAPSHRLLNIEARGGVLNDPGHTHNITDPWHSHSTGIAFFNAVGRL